MVYLLEDDDSIRKLVIYGLQTQGYEAEGFACPSAFWKSMTKQLPALILLDIMLPEEDGLSVLKKLRSAAATEKIPVIMLTAKNTEYDRVVGLDNGADDFICKPFGMMELVARVRAVLRRTQPVAGSKSYRVGELYVNPSEHLVQVEGHGPDPQRPDGPGLGLRAGAGEPHAGRTYPHAAREARPDGQVHRDRTGHRL